MVVPAAVEHLLPPLVDAQHLRVLLAQPGRPRARGRGQHRRQAVVGHPVQDLVQPSEVVDALFRLQRRPGKDPHRERVEARKLCQAHVLLPDDVLFPEPLVGVVVAAVDDVRHLPHDGRVFHGIATAFPYEVLRSIIGF